MLLQALGTSAAAQDARANWLSDANRAWIDAHPVLRHGVISGHEPFEYIDSDGVYNGLTSDYIAIIGERLGIEFEIIHVDNFDDLIARMRAGEIDIATYLPRYRQAHDQLVWSNPVISMPIAVFGRQDASLLLDLPALDQWRTVVEIPSRAQERLSAQWPMLNFVYVDTPEEGLLAIASNEADYFVHNVFSVEYYQRRLGLDPVKIALQTPWNFDIRFAARPGLGPFVELVHKTIEGLSNHERTLIFDKWINLKPEQSIDWDKAVAWGVGVLVIIVTLFLWIIFWNRRLTHEVDARTQDVQSSREAMRALALHMDHIREEEKSRIAREMHDELGHSLTALTMSIRRFGGFLKKEHGHNERSVSQVSDLLELVREATTTSRRIMSDLRPSVLNDLGLVAAIEWLAHEFQSHHGIACRVDAEDLDVELPDGALIALFRIVQESLTNIAKHANATRAMVRLRLVDGELQLDITDDGIGLPVVRNDTNGSFGLMGMGERALALGGELSFSEGKDGGTRVSVRIPVTAL